MYKRVNRISEARVQYCTRPVSNYGASKNLSTTSHSQRNVG